MTYELTEVALRAAVNTATRGISSDSGQANGIAEAANSKAEKLVEASPGSGKSLVSQITQQKETIALAMTGLVIAFQGVKELWDRLKNDRISFEREYLSKVATFSIRMNKLVRDYTNEEMVISRFYDAVARYPNILLYSGIHTAEPTEESATKFMSVLPYFLTSMQLYQPVSSKNQLDKQRLSVGLFLRSKILGLFARIYSQFQREWKIAGWFKRLGLFQGTNYLNDKRAPRFIIMSLANILWNLQHPVNKDGFQLTIPACIKQCREVERFLNELLDQNSEYYLRKLNWNIGFASFLRQVEIHVKALRSAYEEAHLTEVRVDDVMSSAHQALRIMDHCLFKLIFNRKHSKEVSVTAVEELADTVSFLNTLLDQNDEIIQDFIVDLDDYDLSSHVFLNNPPCTVVDLLIIYCHMSLPERKELVKKIEKNQHDSKVEFAKALRIFDKCYLQVVEKASKKELGAWPIFRTKTREVATLTAQRIMPLITLMIEDFGARIDTKDSLQKEIESGGRIRSGLSQVQAINQTLSTDDGYYKAIISPFVSMNAVASQRVDELPQFQYRLTQIAKLMDCVGELINEDRNFLQYDVFQKFLVRCLGKVKGEYKKLEERLSGVDNYIAKDEYINRTLKSILRDMTEHLESSMRSFTTAINQLEKKILAPDFTDRQKKLLVGKINYIHQQFQELFAEDSGIGAMIDINPIQRALRPGFAAARARVDDRVDMDKVFAFKKLIAEIYQSMSYLSKQGAKGIVLQSMINQVKTVKSLSYAQLEFMVLELTRTVACYRPTIFFQAAYAETRSCNALIKKIMDVNFNRRLPLAAMIFKDPTIQCDQITKGDIIKQITSLRDQNQNRWPEATNQIDSFAAI